MTPDERERVHQHHDAQQQRIAALESENARLREALESIAAGATKENMTPPLAWGESWATRLVHRARAALASEPHRNHSQPHSGPIEPRLSVTPKVSDE